MIKTARILVLVADAKKENREAAAEYFKTTNIEPIFAETSEQVVAMLKEDHEHAILLYGVINTNILVTSEAHSHELLLKFYNRVSAAIFVTNKDNILLQRSRWYHDSFVRNGRHADRTKTMWETIHTQLLELYRINMDINAKQFVL